jgi:hypothetical protein
MEFAVDSFTFARLELERVTSVAVHEAKAVGDSTIAVKEHHLVRALGPKGDEVPVSVRVFEIRLRVALLAPDEAREENRIADEEDRRVVPHQIPNTVLCVELHGETSRISYGVCAASLTSDGRETHRNRRPLANLLKNLRCGVLGDVMRDFKVSESSTAFCMLHSFRDALAIKMGNRVEKVDVLQQDRSTRSNCKAKVNKAFWENSTETHLSSSPLSRLWVRHFRSSRLQVRSGNERREKNFFLLKQKTKGKVCQFLAEHHASESKNFMKQLTSLRFRVSQKL